MNWNNITTLKFPRHHIWVPDVFVFKIVDEVKQFGDFQYIVSSDGSVMYIPIEMHKVCMNFFFQVEFIIMYNYLLRFHDVLSDFLYCQL